MTNRLASNIVYVAQLGDCAETPNTGEYNILSAGSSDDLHGFYDLEPIPGLADGLPYGIAVGNHDQALNNDPLSGSTALYNQYFGIAHFTPRAYYAGHFGKNGADGFSTGQDVNDNHYDLFSASGLDFVVIYLEFNDLAVPIPNTDPVQYQPSATEEALWEQGLTWADNVLKTYPNRRGIIVSHWIVEHGNPAPFSTPRCGTCGSPATRLYERLRDNPNLTLMLSGHVTQEGRRTDFYGGRKVHSMLSDYQARAGGGNGWLRILQFSPSNNVIRVWTYSPHLDPNVNSAASTAIPYFETDADSQFVLQYDLQHTPFKEIGSPKTVASGGTATSDPWTGLTPGLECEWYVTVSDGCTTNIGPTRTFNMGAYPYYSWAQYQNAAASASSINSQGYFAGWLQESTFPKSAVEWNNTWFYESGGNPPAIVTSLSDPITYSIEAFGINDSQDLVGSAFFYASGLDRAWAKVGAGQLVFLGTPPSRAYRINNGLTIIGYSTVGANIQACRWSWPNQTASIFGPLPSDVSSLALDINDMPQGQADIVGESTSSAGLKRGFVFYESTGAPLQALAGLDRDDQSSAQGVNNAGTVVGCSFRVGQPARAVRWNKSLSTPPTYTVVELGAPQSSPPGTATYAFKISNTGVIVGAAYNPTGFSHIPSGGWRAVVWHDNIGYYLDPIVDSVDRGFFYLKSANDVNDSGRILTVREGAQAVVVGY